MKSALDQVTEWLIVQLSAVPANIKSVYVEWNNSYLEPNTPREVVLCSMAAFGFEDLSRDNFDPSDPDEELSRLGDFTWEGPSFLRIRVADYPESDWTEILTSAAEMPAVRDLVGGRDLMLLVGYHDDEVYDVS